MCLHRHFGEIVHRVKEVLAMMVVTAFSAGLTWLLWGGLHTVVLQ